MAKRLAPQDPLVPPVLSAPVVRMVDPSTRPPMKITTGLSIGWRVWPVATPPIPTVARGMKTKTVFQIRWSDLLANQAPREPLAPKVQKEAKVYKEKEGRLDRQAPLARRER